MARMINWAEVEEKLKGKLSLGSNVDEVAWNDDMFIEEMLPQCHTSKRADLRTSTLCSKSLLEWYLGGKKPEHYSDLVLAVWQNMRLQDGETHIIPDSQATGGKKTLENPGGDNSADTSTYKSGLIKADASLSTSFVSDWKASMLILLHEKSSTEGHQMAVNIIGFIFMHMMRTCTKDPRDVCERIWNNGINSARNFWGSNIPFDKLIPPSIGMAKQFSFETEKTTSNCQKLLASLVHAYGHPCGQQTNILGILRAGCLLSLQYTGMGIMSWLLKASKSLSKQPNELMKYLACEKFRSITWDIENFLENTPDKGKKQYSWTWARLFKDGAFYGLRSSANWEYTYILVAIVTGLKLDSEIWEIPSLQHDSKETTKIIAMKTAIAVQNVLALGPAFGSTSARDI